MAGREVRISPDGEAVAIRTDKNEDSNQAWGVIHFDHGGAWVPSALVEDWTAVQP